MFVQRLAVLVLLAIPAKACDGILRQTDKGLICGVSLPTGGANFLGIPFAAPPVGDLRWAPPAEPAAWGNKTLNVFDYGPGCPQLHHNPDVPEPQDEDCLSLSVYEPPASCGKELPVMIWFHGGSFEEGGSSLFFYNGTNLASRQCVVVVAGNYRIGAFGAVLTDDLGGNQQLQDQRAVMKWVQKNAASFQGDPSKVTIFGQSAGAMSIGFHLSSPAAAGLFHNAILQSAPNGYPYKDRKQALQYGRMFAKELGCGDGFKADVSCMRSKNTTEVLHAQKAVESKVPGILKIIVEWHSLACLLPFTPSVLENDEFPLQPLEAIKTGKYNKVPLLLGTNAGDAILFVGCGKGNVSATEYTAGIDLAFGSHGHAVNKAYPATKGADAKPALSHMTTDFFFRCPSRALATGASENTPVFMYEFDHALPFNIFNKSCCDNQACHGEEIPLVFDALGIYHLDKASAALGDTIMHMWGNFARSGNPNGDTLPIWPAFNKTAAMRLVLQTPEPKAESTLGGVCDDLWDKFVPFWDRPQGP